jgi:hypothetical protein
MKLEVLSYRFRDMIFNNIFILLFFSFSSSLSNVAFASIVGYSFFLCSANGNKLFETSLPLWSPLCSLLCLCFFGKISQSWLDCVLGFSQFSWVRSLSLTTSFFEYITTYYYFQQICSCCSGRAASTHCVYRRRRLWLA